MMPVSALLWVGGYCLLFVVYIGYDFAYAVPQLAVFMPGCSKAGLCSKVVDALLTHRVEFVMV